MKIEYWCRDKVIRLRQEYYDHRFTIIPRTDEFVKLPGFENRQVSEVIHDAVNEVVRIYLYP